MIMTVRIKMFIAFIVLLYVLKQFLDLERDTCQNFLNIRWHDNESSMQFGGAVKS